MANYTVEAKDGEQVVREVKQTLSNYFSQKQAAALVCDLPKHSKQKLKINIKFHCNLVVI